jgi:hypothetical protein
VNFVSATSNSVLVSPEGQNQYVAWNLGSNDPGTTGTTAAANYLYGFRGGNTTAFWAYALPQATPGVWNNPLDPADVTGFNVQAGGSLAGDGFHYIYALQGALPAPSCVMTANGRVE